MYAFMPIYIRLCSLFLFLAEADLQQSRKDASSLKTQLDEANKQLDTLRKQLDESNKQLDTSKKQLEDSKRQLEEAKKQQQQQQKLITLQPVRPLLSSSPSFSALSPSSTVQASPKVSPVSHLFLSFWPHISSVIFVVTDQYYG